MAASKVATNTTRQRIVAAAADLLERGGPDAVSTRAVGAAAAVKAPTIYRLFGDKQGLLDAVTAHGFEAYLAGKSGRAPAADPVDDLRAGWDLHVEVGLAHPALYELMATRPRSGPPPPAAVAGAEMLAAKIRRVAEAGRLRVSERRAALLFHAAGHGMTMTLIGLPDDERDPELSVLAREATIAAIITDVPAAGEPGLVGVAVALRAALPDATALSPTERALMQEWLDRLAEGED